MFKEMDKIANDFMEVIDKIINNETKTTKP